MSNLLTSTLCSLFLSLSSFSSSAYHKVSYKIRFINLCQRDYLSPQNLINWICLNKNMQKKIKILAAGDIHGSEVIAEHLAIKAEKNKVDLVVLSGDISSPLRREKVMGHFKDRKLETIFVPGNWDSDLDIKFIREIYGTTNVDGYLFKKGGIDFLGLGNSNFRLDHNKKDFEKIEKLFREVQEKSTKKVLISHLHAAGSKAEFSGFKGSYFLRKIIEEFKPDVVISSHIHEAEGIEDKINNTDIFQVGRTGKIIEL